MTLIATNDSGNPVRHHENFFLEALVDRLDDRSDSGRGPITDAEWEKLNLEVVADWNFRRSTDPRDRPDFTGDRFKTYVHSVSGRRWLVVPILNGVDLSNAILRKANLDEISLNGAVLTGADLAGASLCGAHLQGAKLYRAALSNARMTEADLLEAELGEAHLDGADLRAATLHYARLTRASMKECDLTGAKIYATEMTDCDLSGVKCDNIEIGAEGHEKRYPVARNFLPGEFVCLLASLPSVERAVSGHISTSIAQTRRIIAAIRRPESSSAPDPLADWLNPPIAKGTWSGQKADALLLLPLILCTDPRTLEIWQHASLHLSRHISHSSFANCLEMAESEYYAGRLASAQRHFVAMARAVYDRLKEDFAWSNEWESYSPAKSLQPVRLIHHVRAERKGTCLEVVLVYVGCLEGFHFLPLYVHLRHLSGSGCHALAGYWTVPTDQAMLQRDVLDSADVMRHLKNGRLRVVDCTGFVDGKHVSPDGSTTVIGKLSFDEAERFAREYLDQKDWEIDFALNIRRARAI